MQLRRACSRRDTGQLRLCASNLEDGIVQHLRLQAAWHGVRVIDLVILVPFIGYDGELVGARFADVTDDLLRVKAAGNEFLGKFLEQFRVGRWVARADVIQRLNNAGADQVTPHAVDEALGEVAVVACGNPVGEMFASG